MLSRLRSKVFEHSDYFQSALPENIVLSTHDLRVFALLLVQKVIGWLAFDSQNSVANEIEELLSA